MKATIDKLTTALSELTAKQQLTFGIACLQHVMPIYEERCDLSGLKFALQMVALHQEGKGDAQMLEAGYAAAHQTARYCTAAKAEGHSLYYMTCATAVACGVAEACMLEPNINNLLRNARVASKTGADKLEDDGRAKAAVEREWQWHRLQEFLKHIKES